MDKDENHHMFTMIAKIKIDVHMQKIQIHEEYHCILPNGIEDSILR